MLENPLETEVSSEFDVFYFMVLSDFDVFYGFL
jgi:hypothetical protein